MSIIEGAMRGLAKGVADTGLAWMQHGMNTAGRQQEAEIRSQLQREQADLLAEREQSLLEFKANMADRLRTEQLNRVKGAVGDATGVNQQFDAARQAYANAPQNFTDAEGNNVSLDLDQINAHIDQEQQGAISREMRNPASVKAAAMQTGDFDLAKEADGLTEKPMNVPFGNTTIRPGAPGEEAEVIYDGTAKVKEEIERQRVTNSGSSKAAAATDPTKVEKGVRTAVKELIGDRNHPYVDELDKDKAKDTQFASMATELGVHFKKVSPGSSDYDAVRKASTVVDEVDRLNRQLVESRATQLFGEKGTLKNPALAGKLKAEGLDPTNSITFSKTYRDFLLSHERIAQFYKDPQTYASRIQKEIQSANVKPVDAGAAKKFDPDEGKGPSSSGIIQYNR